MAKIFYIRYRKRTDTVFALFVALLGLATVACIIFGGRNTESVFSKQPPAIKGIATDDSVYAVTVAVDSGNTDDIRLVLEACDGYGITVTCFMDVAWMTANKGYVNEISENHILGMLVSGDFSNTSRADVMTYMAVMNDKFMSLTGEFPKYVRYDGENAGCLSSVLTAYGQYYISAETVLSDTAVQIRNGSITEIHPSGQETLFALAKTVATAVSNSLEPISLADMLYPADSEVNANGYQYE